MILHSGTYFFHCQLLRIATLLFRPKEHPVLFIVDSTFDIPPLHLLFSFLVRCRRFVFALQSHKQTKKQKNLPILSIQPKSNQTFYSFPLEFGLCCGCRKVINRDSVEVKYIRLLLIPQHYQPGLLFVCDNCAIIQPKTPASQLYSHHLYFYTPFLVSETTVVRFQNHLKRRKEPTRATYYVTSNGD